MPYDIDPYKVEMGWVIDFCAQVLRSYTATADV
jgi:hypothetical protein